MTCGNFVVYQLLKLDKVLYEEIDMDMGKIIWLNGASSAGKSSLAWKLQEYLDEDYYWLSNDVFADMPHNKMYDRNWTETFRHAITMLYRTVRLYVESGKNVIIDHVMTSDDEGLCEELFDCARFMHSISVMFVFVSCPLEELNKRERARGDRNIGNAAGQFLKLLPGDRYDLVVDTFVNTTEECARLIIDKQRNMLADPNCITSFARIAAEISPSLRDGAYKWICV